MGNDFEREVKRIFDERDFRKEQNEIQKAQEALAVKKEERKKKNRKWYYLFRNADRFCASIAGVLLGMFICSAAGENPVATIFLPFVSAAFFSLSCLFCQLAERRNSKK